MNIRTRFSLLLGGAMALALFTLVSLTALRRGATEEVLARLTSERDALLTRIVELRGLRLRQLAFDYSYWDDLVAYVATPRAAWADYNLRDSLKDFDAHYVWVLRRDGSPIYGASREPGAGPPFPLGPADVAALTSRQPFSHFFVPTPAGPLEIRGAPVQPSADSARQTAPLAWLFVARTWDPAYLASLGKLVEGRAEIYSRSVTPPPVGGGRVVRVQRALPDWQGRPLHELTVDHQPQLLPQLESYRALEAAIAVGWGLATLAALSFMLRRWVLQPLRALETSLATGSPADLAPVAAQRTEFGPLASRVTDSFREREQLQREIAGRRRIETELRTSEQRYRTLFEQAIVGIHRSTPEGRLLAANPAFLRLFGCARPEDFSAVAHVEPGRRGAFLQALAERGTVADFESEVRLPDGSTRWISESARAVKGDAGQLTHIEGFAIDITPRRQLESEMQRASKLESVGVLAGGIAHDFNNLLSVILGNLALADQAGEDAARVRDFARRAGPAAQRARDLTQQLLTFARGGDPVRTTIDLGALLREGADFALHGSTCRAELALATDLWPVDADRGQLGQSLHNICLNAAQAMPRGGIIQLSAANRSLPDPAAPALPPGRYVALTVTDHGPGIPPAHLSRIFDPYFTTKAGGSGLGLAVAYSVVRKHGGAITVESPAGRGATFRLWLPAAHAPAAPPVRDDAPAPPRLSRVLLMDDDPLVLATLEAALALTGAQCDLTKDGAGAVERFRATHAGGGRYDVVIMDLTVPGGMGGREALQQLLVIDPAVRAIVSSGYSHDPVMANHRAHGFRGVLPKPYTPGELFTALRRAL